MHIPQMLGSSDLLSVSPSTVQDLHVHTSILTLTPQSTFIFRQGCQKIHSHPRKSREGSYMEREREK
ncbi:hypothetical protein FKM82_009675 [Ascaphus truei]